jgi:hypothetical protein
MINYTFRMTKLAKSFKTVIIEAVFCGSAIFHIFATKYL